MPQPICLLTGGNAGIGYAAVVQLARAGAEIILAARSLERGAAAVELAKRESGSKAVSLLVMDMSSRQSILDGVRAFRAAGHNRLDVLIHNAADFDVSRKEPVYTEDGIESVWATNHLGPVLLTRELEPELLRSRQARVITVSSQGLMMQPFLQVRLSDPEFRAGRYRVDRAYYQSKLAQVMFTFWLARRFRDTPVTANSVRVTNVKVDVARYSGLTSYQKWLYATKSRFSISPAEMASVYTWLALTPDLSGVSGAYFDHRRGRARAGRYAEDTHNIEAVMELTARYIPGLFDHRE
jgi:NAD(P)-dependent dehydrogenase (short-subunit alcohol dehydrogenase family)